MFKAFTIPGNDENTPFPLGNTANDPCWSLFLLLWTFSYSLRGIVEIYAGLFLIAYVPVKLLSPLWGHRAWTISFTAALYIVLLTIIKGPYVSIMPTLP